MVHSIFFVFLLHIFQGFEYRIFNRSSLFLICLLFYKAILYFGAHWIAQNVNSVSHFSSSNSFCSFYLFCVLHTHTHTRTHTLLVCFHFHFVIWKMNEIFPFHNEVLNRNERHQNFNTIQYNILSTQNFYKIVVWTYCNVVLSDSINVHCEGETKGKVKASRWLETQIVMTTYSRRAFRVDEIEWHATPEFSFTTCDQKVRPLTNNLHSLLKYFQILQHYHLSLLCCCYCCMSENDIQRIHGEST